MFNFEVHFFKKNDKLKIIDSATYYNQPNNTDQ